MVLERLTKLVWLLVLLMLLLRWIGGGMLGGEIGRWPGGGGRMVSAGGGGGIDVGGGGGGAGKARNEVDL